MTALANDQHRAVVPGAVRRVGGEDPSPRAVPWDMRDMSVRRARRGPGSRPGGRPRSGADQGYAWPGIGQTQNRWPSGSASTVQFSPPGWKSGLLAPSFR
ncbi:hypothetical protein GCM10010466_53590 [Planomonospora alba]|uniref:Uncharacterized protein n=1 Tax=Planomonospora alba TaxID=161354 RepID=A0ABP6NSE7_9ACTN